MSEVFKSDRTEVTVLLNNLSEGDDDDVDKLLPILYQDLQKMARNQLNRERANHTLNTTALVHEVYLQLVDQKNKLEKPGTFFCYMCTDHATYFNQLRKKQIDRKKLVVVKPRHF